MADGVDPSADAVEAPGLEAVIYGVITEECPELAASYDPVLPAREGGDSLFSARWMQLTGI